MDKKVAAYLFVFLMIHLGYADPVNSSTGTSDSLHIISKEEPVKVMLDKEKLFKRALDESCLTIRAGIPGKIPFWNSNATQFIYAPSFNFPLIEGAVKYRFTAIAETDQTKYSFTDSLPWTPLTPIWKQLPIGNITLTVEGLNEEREAIGTLSTKKFYRAAVFSCPYSLSVNDYRNSAYSAFAYLFNSTYLQHWLTEGTPDPDYSLYCYPSKMITAVIKGMLYYSHLDTTNREDALRIAEIAAGYLIQASEPTGSPLEYFPPTYNINHVDSNRVYKDDIDVGPALIMLRLNKSRIMLTYPCLVANAYLDLYNCTKKTKYYQAAMRICTTYARIQINNGYWYLLVEKGTENPVAENYAHTDEILPLFWRMRDEYGVTEFDKVIKKAEMNLDETYNEFNFEGQFEDVLPSTKYENLANEPALKAARYYLGEYYKDTLNVSKAKEFLRFAEDQFVIWSDPQPRKEMDRQWVSVPCAMEQYKCYVPIDEHAANFARVFFMAYRKQARKYILPKQFLWPIQ